MNGPVALVAASTVVLPSWARDRYQVEMSAELADLPWLSRWRHAAGFAATIWSLRSAVLRGAAEARGFPAPPRLCLWGLHHRWEFAWTDDGQRFRQCHRCGVDDPRSGHTPTNPSMAGIIITGPPQ